MEWDTAGQIMTEVQNFSHYAINKFPCFKVAIGGESGVGGAAMWQRQT